MKAIILSVGDELVLGQTVDTNSAWISAQLSAIGCDTLAHKTVGDDQAMIAASIRESASLADVLLISGGIGPTEDDLTRQALAEVMNAPLVMNEVWLAKLLEFFKNRGRSMPETNKIQAMIPSGATMLDNPAGTAAGIRATIANRCEVFSVPGVPKEMNAMFAVHIQPYIKERSRGAVILQKKLNTFGLGESWVAEKLGDLMARGRNPSIGTTVAGGMVSLRLNARFESLERAEHEIIRTVEQCTQRLGDVIFSEDNTSLADVVATMLKDQKVQVTTAESCTGGLLAKMLTDIPGSSGYFKTGFITYANSSKYDRLGVNRELLGIHGAVSEPVVEAMAKNALKLAKANVALSISGIAGPDGATQNKPVGTVCIGMAWESATKFAEATSRTFNFPGDREMVRDRSAKMALSLLRYHLMGRKMPF